MFHTLAFYLQVEHDKSKHDCTLKKIEENFRTQTRIKITCQGTSILPIYKLKAFHAENHAYSICYK